MPRHTPSFLVLAALALTPMPLVVAAEDAKPAAAKGSPAAEAATAASVAGKVVVPADTKKKIDMANAQGVLYTMIKRERVPFPEGLKNDQKRAWYTKWQQTDEGKAYQKRAMAARAKYRRHPVTIKEDGTFKVDGLAPGQYGLSVTVGSGQSYQATLSESGITVADKPVNLGKLTLTVINRK